MKPSIYKENKNLAIISLITVLLSILITYIYIVPKLEGDALFDQNEILKDQWSSLEQGTVIDNEYNFSSDNSKLSSIVLVVQNLDEELSGTVKATVYDKNGGQLLIEQEAEILPNTSSYDLKIDIDEKKAIENIIIELENTSNNNNLKTRITDTDDIENGHLAYKIYSTMPNFVQYIAFIAIIIVDIMIIVGIYLTLEKKIGLEKLFLVIAFLCGITFTILFTPGTIPDETIHIRNTLGYSSILMSKGTRDNIKIRECEQFVGDTQPSIKTLNTYRDSLIKNDNSSKYISTGIELSSDFSVMSYLPGILTVTICRLLSIGGILTIYLARFSNFIFYLFVAYFSIKKIPIFKNALFTLALLPMVIQQTISLSYDTIIIGTAWVVISYGFHFVYGTKSIEKVDVLVYIISSCVLITQKTGIYFVLNLIPLLIGKDRIAEKKERILLKLILVFPWIITMFGLPIITNNNRIERTASDGNIISWANREGYSLQYFINHKMETIMLFIRTIVKKFDHYIFTTLGQYLGSLNLVLSRNIFIGWLISIFVSAFKTDSDNKDIPFMHRILYILAFFAVCGASMLAMAFAFTPVGWPTIEGVQGRYFLPVLILLVIFVRNKKIMFKKNYDRYYIIWVIILQGITIINIVGQLLLV